MLIHGTRTSIDTRADDTAEEDIPSHRGATATTDLRRYDDGPFLITGLADEDGQRVAAGDLEAGWGLADHAGRKTDVRILRNGIDDEDFLTAARNRGTTREKSEAEQDKEQASGVHDGRL